MTLRRSILAAAGLVLAWTASASAEVRGVLLDRPEPLPAFMLEDQGGNPFSGKRLQGRWSLILMGFTNCPDVCPFTLGNLEAVVAEMSTLTTPDRLPQVIFLAVDPARDKAVLADYVHSFHPDFLGVTGDLKQIDVLVHGLDGAVRRGKPDRHGNYEVRHSAAVSVVDPQGRLAAKLSPPFEPAQAATYLVNMMRAYARSAAGDRQ